MQAARYAVHRSSSAGEVLAATGVGTAVTPRALVRGLLESPSHRRILRDGKLRDVGAAVVWGAATTQPRAGATLVMVLGRRAA